MQQNWDDQCWLNDFRLSKAIFLEIRTWETQSIQKFGNMKEIFLWIQNPQPYITIIEDSTAGL